MIKFHSLVILFLFLSSSFYSCAQDKGLIGLIMQDYSTIKTGAEQLDQYLPLLKNKKIAIVANPASIVGNSHLVDTLLSHNIDLAKIFCPEHGFRGEAEAGELISDGKDIKTGLKLTSLYGDHKKPSTIDLLGIDLVVFDLQDVGTRFYTYISTLTYVMEACSEQNIPVILLDRPNPNGYVIDGPVLDTSFSSFVGMHKVPVLYGMTIGEYGLMVNGEKWMKNEVICDLKVIPLKNYHRKTITNLPVPPSPNLPNWQSVYLYPSLCFFEGTIMSIGRGTDYPFQIYGHPDFGIGSFTFAPKSIPGKSLHPKFENENCYGQHLSGYANNFQNNTQGLNLNWLLSSYEMLSKKYDFFTDYFDVLAGTDRLRIQIESGMTEEDIRKSWQKDLQKFNQVREKYLLYD